MVGVGHLQLHLLDVGQGEAIVLDFPDGDFGLIDAGPAASIGVVLEAIRQRRSEGRTFRFAALTHWDMDHIGGLPEVLKEFRPEELVQPNVDLATMEEICASMEGELTSSLFRALDDAASGLHRTRLGARMSLRDVSTGVEIWALSPAGTVDERVRDAVRHPTRAHFRKLRNAASLVLWIRAFGTSVLLPGEVDGDAARELEQAFGYAKGLIHHDDYRVVWLKLSHHGSRTGTDPELLRIFAHEEFVASASHGARYGHPHPRVLDIIQRSSGRMMCTRLGKGCHMINTRALPAVDPVWADSTDWNAEAMIEDKCYGTISVDIDTKGGCTISGAQVERLNCPYGGPADGRITLSRR
jgi:competence protein ComEC